MVDADQQTAGHDDADAARLDHLRALRGIESAEHDGGLSLAYQASRG